MKKKFFILGIIIILVMSLFLLTGCSNNENNSNSSTENKQETSTKNIDEGEQVIYEYARCIREKDVENLFKVYKTKFEEEIQDIKETLNDEQKYSELENYTVTKIIKIENEEDYINNKEEKKPVYKAAVEIGESRNYKNMYLVFGTRAGNEFQDIFYLDKENKIVTMVTW